jgi:DNA-binding CsgD family transcriptional regulator
MGLEKFIAQSNEIKDPDDLHALLEEALAAMCGFDHVVFGLISDHPSLGLKAGHGIMRKYKCGWMQQFAEEGHEHLDPVRRFRFRPVGPYIWDELPLITKLMPQKTLHMTECRESGFHCSASVALRGTNGELGGIGVSNRRNTKSENEGDKRRELCLLNMIAHQYYMAFCHLHSERTAPAESTVSLTRREMEVLLHIAHAKKEKAIAFDLNISKHAVGFHVRNILKKFNAHNKMAAVLKAINSGSISLDQTCLGQNRDPH